MEYLIESLECYLTKSPTMDESPTQEYYRGSDFDEHIEEILDAQLEEERMLEQHRAQSIQLEVQYNQEIKDGILAKATHIDHKLTNTPLF